MAPGASYAYPQTDVRFVLGGDDCGIATTLAQLYAGAITTDKSVTVVPGVDHYVPTRAAGAAQVVSDLTSGCALRH